MKVERAKRMIRNDGIHLASICWWRLTSPYRRLCVVNQWGMQVCDWIFQDRFFLRFSRKIIRQQLKCRRTRPHKAVASQSIYIMSDGKCPSLRYYYIIFIVLCSHPFNTSDFTLACVCRIALSGCRGLSVIWHGMAWPRAKDVSPSTPSQYPNEWHQQMSSKY